MLTLLWLGSVGLATYGLALGYGVVHSLQEGGVIAVLAAAATLTSAHRALASALVSAGMMTASAVLVHLSGGLIEAHFLFFVMVIVLTLYEDWVPFLVAAAYVLLHHGVVGVIDPESVYNHADAIAHPWKWAGIHALFVTAAGTAGVVAWRLNERARSETEEAYRRASASEKSLVEAQDLSRIGSYEVDLATGEVRWSQALYDLYGVDPETFTPQSDAIMALVVPEDRKGLADAAAAAIAERRGFSHEFRIRRPDGKKRSFDARGEVVLDDTGNVVRLVGTCQDVTERLRTERALERRAREQAAVAELGERALGGAELVALMTDAVAITAHVLEVEIAAVMERRPASDDFVVRAATGVMSEVIGTPIPGGHASQAGYTMLTDEAVTVEDWEEEKRFRRPALLAALEARSGMTVLIKGRTDVYGVLGVQSKKLRRFGPDEVNFLQSTANVLAAAIERSGTEDEIRHQAVHDPLTGLPNRSLFADRLSQALAHARRHHTSVAVLFCDLDQFKLVNDSLGHEAGDELLRTVAPRITQALRAEDTVARFGGDEFGVLVEEVITERDATRVAERISGALARPFVLRGREHYVTATIGIAIGEGGEAPQALIRDADAAMYRAKERGRGRYEIFDEAMRARVTAYLQTENELRRAIDRNEMCLYYQPVVSLDAGRIIGLEALLRWQHPERGLIPPGEFIPVAEESGLIVSLGSWVLSEAARQAASWHAEAPDSAPIGVSVNLSARQVGDPGVGELVRNVLRASGVEPASLSLEITESALMEDSDTTLATLSEVKSLGVGLVLDDFGTGFSSLGYLRRFPFDSLKIDRAFIERLVSEPGDRAIVGAVTEIAEALGLILVAEGVETEAQLEILRELGCHFAQGFLFARPLPASEMGMLLSRSRASATGAPVLATGEASAA
jgi:diguanylate cyclase (GGDEF)-like protein/PAS domain S-box-containing protein